MARQKSLLYLHSSVALFGLAGLFGRWLNFNPLIIVGGRVLFAAIALAIILGLRKGALPKLSVKLLYRTAVSGAILALHWYAFFKSIQETSVALALLSFASFPLFTLILESVFWKLKVHGIDVLWALMSISGTALIVPWDMASPETNGVLWGLFAGFSFAVLNLLNKDLVKKHSALEIGFYQDIWATLVLLPFCIAVWPQFTAQDIGLLILLGTVFTALSHFLFLAALKDLKARTAALVTALEPVYGIAAAYFLFQETPELTVFLGGILILVASLGGQRREKA
ncbi:DMT family transporter [Croceimicrobium hydrocarbonivorans]|uniref:DMT family transporter n=1 Tax=Croceimicrobium hydrocarbonivorans TaxID=2761580 RepID=A0A7H0VEA1_9FLAO|nr:DMT family transporter [Croceimicrobium hydrocarbonivorans]QNR24049.1 DMT family transporter [Croceimicrobium hydrocarbonivorans]